MVRKRTILFTTLIFILLLSACAPAAVATPTAENSSGADLSGIKTYLLDKSSELTSSSKSLKEASDRYYALAEAAGFELLVTTDQNLLYQQNLLGRKIGIFILGRGNWPEIKISAD